MKVFLTGLYKRITSRLSGKKVAEVCICILQGQVKSPREFIQEICRRTSGRLRWLVDAHPGREPSAGKKDDYQAAQSRHKANRSKFTAPLGRVARHLSRLSRRNDLFDPQAVLPESPSGLSIESAVSASAAGGREARRKAAVRRVWRLRQHSASVIVAITAEGAGKSASNFRDVCARPLKCRRNWHVTDDTSSRARFTSSTARHRRDDRCQLVARNSIVWINRSF